MKKGIVIALGVGVVLLFLCAGGIGSLVYFVFQATAAPVTATQDFLSLLGQGKINEAYKTTSSQFQARQDEKSFDQWVNRFKINEYESSFWSSRNIKNNDATIKGNITLKNGGSIAATVNLIYENSTWRVQSVQVQPAGGLDKGG